MMILAAAAVAALAAVAAAAALRAVAAVALAGRTLTMIWMMKCRSESGSIPTCKGGAHKASPFLL
jgi:hypothetical protein